MGPLRQPIGSTTGPREWTPPEEWLRPEPSDAVGESVGQNLSQVWVSEVIGGDFRGNWSHDHGMAYTHFLTPNSRLSDALWGPGCLDRRNAPCQSSVLAFGLINMAARSNHTGGVNVLLGDGSVRFVQNDVDAAVWQASASINAGETLTVSGL